MKWFEFFSKWKIKKKKKKNKQKTIEKPYLF